MLLSATKAAPYSVLPSANHSKPKPLQYNVPTRLKSNLPCTLDGLLKNKAKTNIRTGPITQFKRSEMDNILVFLNTLVIMHNSLCQRGIHHNNKTNGNGYVGRPRLMLLMIFGALGIKYPKLTPIPMATKIHSVRFLSRKLNFFWAMIYFNF